MKPISAYEWYKNKLIKILIKTIKHTLALPAYPFFALSYVLKKLDNIIDYCLGIYLSIIKKIKN